jgi:hypothetical protein
MTEKWIDGLRAAAQAQVDKTAEENLQARLDKVQFEAEETTVETVAAHITRFEAPVQDIAKALERMGFVVEEKGPKLLLDRGISDRRKYSKTHTTHNQIDRNIYTDNYIFGKEWVVQNLDGEEALATVRIYPTADGRTHFAGAQYVFWNGDVEDGGSRIPRMNFAADMLELEAEDGRFEVSERITEGLQRLFGGIVIKALAEQAMRKDPRFSKS